MSAQSTVSDLLWVLVRNAGRWILLRSSAAEVSGLQKDTEDSGPILEERWGQGSLQSEQDIPQWFGDGDTGLGCFCGLSGGSGNVYQPLRNLPHLRRAYPTGVPTVAT